MVAFSAYILPGVYAGSVADTCLVLGQQRCLVTAAFGAEACQFDLCNFLHSSFYSFHLQQFSLVSFGAVTHGAGYFLSEQPFALHVVFIVFVYLVSSGRFWRFVCHSIFRAVLTSAVCMRLWCLSASDFFVSSGFPIFHFSVDIPSCMIRSR